MEADKVNETNEANATNETDAAIEREKENDEMGARPKVKEAADVQFKIKLFRDIKLSESKDILLKICQFGLEFVNDDLARVNLENIRYVSKDKQLEKEYIILSFKNIESGCVSNIFFETEDIEGCYNKIQELIVTKLESQCATAELAKEAANMLVKQPVFSGTLLTLVQEKKDGDLKMQAPGGDSPTFFVIIDVECISWYSELSVKPKYQLMFWSEETPVSIESVRLHHSMDFIMFESQTQALTLERNHKIVNSMKLLRPKKTDYLADFHKFQQSDPSLAAWSRRVDPPTSEDWDAEANASNQQPGGPFRSLSSQWGLPSQDGGWQISPLQVELDSAKEHFKKNEDFCNIWITHLEDLKQMEEGGTVPKTEVSSGGLDPNNYDHFEKAVLDVGDYVKSEEMSTAMSRVQALRETFKDSNQPQIQKFLGDLDNYDLIERLFYKGMLE